MVIVVREATNGGVVLWYIHGDYERDHRGRYDMGGDDSERGHGGRYDMS